MVSEDVDFTGEAIQTFTRSAAARCSGSIQRMFQPEEEPLHCGIRDKNQPALEVSRHRGNALSDSASQLGGQFTEKLPSFESADK